MTPNAEELQFVDSYVIGQLTVFLFEEDDTGTQWTFTDESDYDEDDPLYEEWHWGTIENAEKGHLNAYLELEEKN